MSEPSRAARVGRGISASLIAQAIQAVQAIVLVRFFIGAWGVEGYGRWVTLSVIASYLALLDLGGQNYVANVITIEFARGNFEAFRARLGEALSFFIMLALSAFMVVAGSLIVFLRVDVPFLDRTISSSEAWVIGLLAAQTLVLGVPGGLYATLYRAVGKYVRGAMVGNIFRTIAIVLGIGALLCKSSQATYAAYVLTMSCALTIALVWDSRRIVPELRGLRLSVDGAWRGARLLRGSVPFLAIAVAQGTSHQIITTFLAGYRSPIEVGVFASHRTLANIPNYIGPLVQGPMLPEMSTLWGLERLDDLRRIAMTAVRTVVFLTGAVAMAVWVGGELAFRLWTSRTINVHATLLLLLLAQAFVAAVASTCTWGPLAANHHRVVTRIWMGSWLLTVGSAIFLVRRWGAEGAAVALLAGDVVFKLLGFPLAAASFYKSPSAMVYKHVLRGAAYLVPHVVLVIGLRLHGGGVVATMACLGCMGAITLLLAMPVMRPRASFSTHAQKKLWSE